MPKVALLPVPEIARETHYERSVLAYSQRPRNFNAVVWLSVQAFPEKTALIFEGRRWSYRQLWQEACSFAAVIHQDYGIIQRDSSRGLRCRDRDDPCQECEEKHEPDARLLFHNHPQCSVRFVH